MAKRRRFKAAPRARDRRAGKGAPLAQATTPAEVELKRRADHLDRLGGRVDAVVADAEHQVEEELVQATQRAEQAEAAATRVLEEAKARDRRRHALAAERALHGEAAARGSRERGLLDRLRARVAAWQRRRHQRALLRRLDRALARRELRVADQSAAALLAVLTERIARLSTTTASPAELEDTLAIAQQLSDEYASYLLRLRAARDASGSTPALRDKATLELSRCEAGKFRIDDAIAQLRALGKRSAPPR